MPDNYKDFPDYNQFVQTYFVNLDLVASENFSSDNLIEGDLELDVNEATGFSEDSFSQSPPVDDGSGAGMSGDSFGDGLDQTNLPNFGLDDPIDSDSGFGSGYN